MKVSETTGVSLDWMVAKAIGEYKPVDVPKYSTDWSQGGPIIEREEICTKRQKPCSIGYEWNAWSWTKNSGPGGSGPTPLIAAMRCYVASKLGDEVEVPEGL